MAELVFLLLSFASFLCLSLCDAYVTIDMNFYIIWKWKYYFAIIVSLLLIKVSGGTQQKVRMSDFTL